MTNELEKQFFDTFGIEPHYYCANEYIFDAMLEDECTDGNRAKCKTCKKVGKTYPQITDSILLELICILGNTSYFLITDDGLPINVDGLKKTVLHSLTLQAKIDKNRDFKHQVRTLFEEG